jgi:hypothetical protein
MAQTFWVRSALWALALLLATASPGVAQVALRKCAIEGQAVRCGTLRVPENPGASDGRVLSVGILIAPRTGAAAPREPMFVLTGGPGAAATSDAEFFLDMLRPVRAAHDVVLMDQRGTAGDNRMQCEVADRHFFRPA